MTEHEFYVYIVLAVDKYGLKAKIPTTFHMPLFTDKCKERKLITNLFDFFWGGSMSVLALASSGHQAQLQKSFMHWKSELQSTQPQYYF